MVSPQREHPPAREKIQVTAALGIEEPRAFPAYVVLIETDGADRLHKRGVEIPLVQFILAALLGVQPREKSLVHSMKGGEPHGAPCAGSR